MDNLKTIPCHLINGPLGVGKTTAIIDYLRRHAERQFVAVLVNDFGPVGMDEAIIEGDLKADAGERPKFVMVPGGCICCSAAPGFMVALQEIGKMERVDRVIVEPSGLALVGDMIDLLLDWHKGFRLDLRPVITLLDPKDLDRKNYTQAPYNVRLFEAAEVLVANRCDLYPPEMVERFRRWAEGLYPPKLKVITTHHGQLPDEVFEMCPPRRSSGRTPTPAEGNGHTDSDHAGGLTWDASVMFAVARLEAALGTWAREGFQGMEIARLKAIFHTNEGWRLMEIARGEVFVRPTDYRRDNRVDWITASRPLRDDQVGEVLSKCIF